MNKRIVFSFLLVLIAAVILIASLYDIINNKGWTTAIFVAYGLLLLPILGMMISTRKTTHEDQGQPADERQFRCPACKETFQVLIPPNQTAFNHICPHCGYFGSITLPTYQ